MRHDRSRLSQIVQEKEVMRDRWFRKLRSNLREIVEMATGEKQQAGTLLYNIVEEYGGAQIPLMKLEAETGVLLNLYDDLQQKYAEQLELLGLTAVVDDAKQSNDEFIEAQNRRTQSDADYGKGTMEQARLETAKRYRLFIDSVNLEADDDGDGELTPFINYMNVKVSEMRHLTGQNPVGSSSGSSSESEEGAPMYKFTTFVYVGGTEVKLKVEVGTPLIAPDNTEGYHWAPEVPELMPKTSKTFREVPIEEEGSEDSENSELDPAENIKIVFKNQFNQPVHEVIVPVDYQMTESEYPTPPEGTHWNYTLADLNLAIGMKQPGDTITVRAQAD